MEEQFWHDRWEQGQIGFHEKQANALLVKHLDKLELTQGAKIFIPLCGKTLDISYLLTLGYQIVGVEFSELAIKELFEELGISPTTVKEGNYIRYQAENIVIFVGDFFDLNAELLGSIEAIYDRASLIALPEDIRQRYVKHLTAITDTKQQLLVTIDYDQTLMDGPPFSIDTQKVNQHHANNYFINCLERNAIEGGFKGKYEGYESIFLLSPKT